MADDDNVAAKIGDLIETIIAELQTWRVCKECGMRYAPGVECPHYRPSINN